MSSFVARAIAAGGVRRVAPVVVAVSVVLAALVAIGRWERHGEVADQVRGMRSVRALIGPLDNPTLSGFRALPAFDCLVYRRGGNPFAVEICVDGTGRVVEAIDRRASGRHIYTLRFEPTASTLRVDRREVDRLLRRMGALPG